MVDTIDGDRFGIMELTNKTLRPLFLGASHLGASNGEQVQTPLTSRQKRSMVISPMVNWNRHL